MQLQFIPYSLRLRHVFSIAGSSRTETPVVFVRLFAAGNYGYGEASLPPYLPENQGTVTSFLNSLDLRQFKDAADIETIMSYVNSCEEGNLAAKASIDIALHDLKGKLVERPLWQLLSSEPSQMPDTSCTLGLDTLEAMRTKLAETLPYKILKIKLGGPNDKQVVELVRTQTFKPLCADVNQGWIDKHEALDMLWFLKDLGFKFVEQPMPKGRLRDMIWLSENSPLPLVADESCQTVKDIEALHGVFRGINIKLMKCGGIIEARKMIDLAQKLDMKILFGCMNESSCAILAAAALAPYCNWADLDGPFLIANNPFEDVPLVNGKLVLSTRPGLGLGANRGTNEPVNWSAAISH